MYALAVTLAGVLVDQGRLREVCTAAAPGVPRGIAANAVGPAKLD